MSGTAFKEMVSLIALLFIQLMMANGFSPFEINPGIKNFQDDKIF